MRFRHVLWDSPHKSLKAALQVGLTAIFLDKPSRDQVQTQVCVILFPIEEQSLPLQTSGFSYTQFVLDFLREEPATGRPTKTEQSLRENNGEICWGINWSQYEPWEGVVEDRVYSPEFLTFSWPWIVSLWELHLVRGIRTWKKKTGLRIHSLLH